MAKGAFRLRAAPVELTRQTLDRSGLRRTWWGAGENLQKRYFVHVAGCDLGLVMPLLVGPGPQRSSCRSCATEAGFCQRANKAF